MDDGQGLLFEVPDDWWVNRRRCAVCGCALSVVHSHLYVVQRQGWIKIGATDNLRRRINELSRPAWTKHILSPEGMDWLAPLATVAVIIGGGFLEHEVHLQFRGIHARGEWFLEDAQIHAWIASKRHETVAPESSQGVT